MKSSPRHALKEGPGLLQALQANSEPYEPILPFNTHRILDISVGHANPKPGAAQSTPTCQLIPLKSRQADI